jgi:hypothetical protein
MRKIVLVKALLLVAIFAFPQQKRIVLQNVHVVDVVKGAILKNQNVIISGDRITGISRSARFTRQDSDSLVECSGQYLIPGLWDMHTHVWGADYFFSLFIANGVTGIRGMFETMFNVNTWKKSAATPGSLTPTGFYAGPIVDGPTPVWPGSVAVRDTAGGRRAVDSLKNKLQVDFIKVYSMLGKDSYYAIADEAKRQQIDFAGHVPNTITPMDAAKAGQKSMEHLYGFIEMASDSSDYYYSVMRGDIKDTLIRNNRMARRALLARTFSEKKLLSLFSEMKKYDTWICPTMTVLRGIAYIKDSAFIKDPRMVYAMQMIKNMWNPSNDFRLRSLSNEYFENEKKEFEVNKRIVKLLHQSGIKILAGTDTPNPHCYPGFSLHDELQIFVDCGLNPAEALRTATLNPALYFKIEKDYGTVSTNKIASLVLLKANPLDNIANTKNISAVILRGKFIGTNELNELLARARKIAGN